MLFSHRFITRCALFILTPALAFAAPIGKVSSLEGVGTIQRGDSEIPLALATPIEQNDVIKTDDGGKTTIEFEDKSTLTIGSKAMLTIDQYVYDPEAKAGNVSALSVGSGFFHFVSGKLARDKVKIKTPITTIGIRGTEFFGEVKYNGETAVSLVKCCADVINEAGKTALDREGFYTEVASKDKAPTRADLTPEHFYKTASSQLGIPADKLGLKNPTPIPSLEEIQRQDGPADRKTFPHIGN